jgi:hypothetical protein
MMLLTYVKLGKGSARGSALFDFNPDPELDRLQNFADP